MTAKQLVLSEKGVSGLHIISVGKSRTKNSYNNLKLTFNCNVFNDYVTGMLFLKVSQYSLKSETL